MKTIRTEDYTDIDGDLMQVDFHDTFIELNVFVGRGCFPMDDVKQIRQLAATLLEAADFFEGKS